MNDREIQDWYYETRAKKLIKNLAKKGIKGEYASTGDEAREKILSLIPEGSTVYFTGSQTLEQIGVKPFLRGSDKYNLIDPYEPGIDQAENTARRKKGLTAEIMLSSTNAITEDGALVNVDGQGNRVAAMIFGPDKVYLAVGMNKVVIKTFRRRFDENRQPRNIPELRPAKYNTESELVREVTSGGQVIDFNLTTAD